MATHGIWEVHLLRDCRLFQQLVSQARPNQRQRGSLSVSRTGKEVILKAVRAGVGWVSWVWLVRLFNYKHSNGGTGGGCTIVLVMLPLVSLDSDNGSHRGVNTAATLQAVYLVWLFLRITTTCNLSINRTSSQRISEIARACANSGYQATFPSSHVAWVRG